MPIFCYEALDPQGELVTGKAKAPAHIDLVVELKKVGYEVRRVWQKPPYVPGFRIWSGLWRVPLSELALLTRELGMFFASGIGLLRGMESIQGQGFSKQTTRACGDVSQALAQGHSLSQSMALRPDVFEPMYVRLIHAGEVSGALDRILEKLSEYLERELILTRRVQSAMAYPALIFFVCLGLTAFMVFFLFPTFVSFFDGLDIRLPAITRSLLVVTTTARDPAFIIASVIVAFIASRIYESLARRESAVIWFSGFLLNAPVVGPIKRAVVLSRFCSTLSILMKAGVPQYTALSISAASIGNRAAETALQTCAMRIRDDGDSLSEALGKESLFPRMLISLIVVGEEVGDIPKVLDLAVNGFELEIDRSISQFTVLLEPLMLSFMGLVVGYVLLAVFLPVYSMLEGL